MALYNWCLDNNLSLNVSKTKEMIVDYQKQPVHSDGVEVERDGNFRFLGINITEDLSWTLHTDTVNQESSPTTLLPEESVEGSRAHHRNESSYHSGHLSPAVPP